MSWTVLGLYNGGKRKAGRKEENEGKKKQEKQWLAQCFLG